MNLINLGPFCLLSQEDILFVSDLDTVTMERRSANNDFLTLADQEKRLIHTDDGLPQTLIVTDSTEADVYLSQISYERVIQKLHPITEQQRARRFFRFIKNK